MWKIKNTISEQTALLSIAQIIDATDRHNGVFLFSKSDAPLKKGLNIIGLNPVIKISDNTTVYGNRKITAEPLKIISDISATNRDTNLDIPLFAGYIGYDFKNKIEEENLFQNLKKDKFPDIYFCIYQYYLIYNNDSPEKIKIVKLDFPFNYKAIDLNVIFTDKKRNRTENKQSYYQGTNLPKKQFCQGVEKIRQYVKSGDIYQANLTREIEGTTEYTPAEAALKLYNSNKIEFGVFARIENNYLISTSPERFIKVKQNKIISSPIKGTIARTDNEKQNEINKSLLLNCDKNRPELAMIVDLMRNDMNRICETGSVEVKEFPILKELQNVYHLVANIEGNLTTDNFATIIKALFPGGSITGCPKIRACQIIEELEKSGRGPYTGSYGYYNFNGDMDFNILIRTLFYYAEKDEKGNNKFSFNVGGGITLKSDPVEEYEETIHKAKNIYDAMNIEEIWEERYCLTAK